jgi:hypothetical protein
MSQQTLKELLKPPFYHAGIGHIFDGNTRLMDVPGYIPDDEDKKDSHVANVRGWGFFQYFENGEQLQDEFIEFVVQALNEKRERDFGEPDCWLIEGAFLVCPKCGDYHPKDKWKISDNYCPYCGKRLKLPPEEKQE